MTVKEAINFINTQAQNYLQPDNAKTGFVCPLCNSGRNGKNGTGLSTKDNIHFTCWSCGKIKNSSLVDIIALKNGIDPKNNLEAVKVACNEFKIDLDNQPTASNYSQSKTTQKEIEINFNQFEKASENQNAFSYLQTRGITKETADRFNLRYSDKIYNPQLKRTVNALIIPTSSSSYNARTIEPCESNQRFIKPKGISYKLLNIELLETSTEPIFITEGEIDALTILQAGYNAIALGGVANINKLILEAKEKQFKQPLIMALDNDDVGLKAINELKSKENELKADGLKLYFPDVKELYFSHKDSNEAYLDNDFHFEGLLGDCFNDIKEISKKEAQLELNKWSVASYKESFLKVVEDSKTQKVYTPTGFKLLDEKLEGGLYNGLYVIGAVSSLGKTTLCLQIADQMATAGKDILIFSLEMSKDELIAKSISRLTSVLDVEKTRSNTNAKTARGILTGSRYENYSDNEKKLITEATDKYFDEIAPHLFIAENTERTKLKTIENSIENYQSLTGKAPIVLIDYLQILAPENDYQDDKRAVDSNITGLRRLSRRFKTPVIAVSSLNRASYFNRVNMASFKESGAIEYSADVLIGLNDKEKLALANKKDDERDNALAEIEQNRNERRKPTPIELCILKNRFGAKDTSVNFDFFPMFNKFNELEEK